MAHSILAKPPYNLDHLYGGRRTIHLDGHDYQAFICDVEDDGFTVVLYVQDALPGMGACVRWRPDAIEVSRP